MKIVVPYSANCKALESVRVCLAQDGYNPDYVLMDREESYYDLVESLWKKGEPFIINEHDIIAWPGAIKHIQECRMPWCTYLYRCPAGWIRNGLGLVKFEPDKLPNPFPLESKEWPRLDSQIAGAIEAHGRFPHCHEPAVTNLNPVVYLHPQRCEMRMGRFLTEAEARI